MFTRRHLASTFHDYRSAIIDATVILAILGVIFFAIQDLGLFEKLHDALGPDKETVFDELIIVILFASIGLIVFGGRRIADQCREIAARQKAEDRASYLALADTLTGLPNRRRFEAKLDETLARLADDPTPVALMMIDLDRFKPVNDVFGHATGDQVLVAFSKRAQGVAPSATLARFGGDEFALLLPPNADADEPSRVARRLLALFDRPFDAGGARVTLGASIGIAMAPENAVSGAELMRCADIALYRAKHHGRGTFRFFEPSMDAQVKRRAQIEADLREALEANLIQPSYQPVVALEGGAIIGFEVAPSWSHPRFGDIPPAQLMAIAEDSGLITDLSSHILRTACRDAATWPRELTLSFPLSGLQLADSMLALRVIAILGETGLSPNRLQLEISEHALVRDTDAARQALAGLHKAGINVALDAFGSGESSLYQLRDCPFDRVKIDGTFIRSMGRSTSDAAFVSAIVNMSKSLGFPVSAKGIDDPALIARLQAEGCDQGQGVSIGAPMSAAEALAAVERRVDERAIG